MNIIQVMSFWQPLFLETFETWRHITKYSVSEIRHIERRPSTSSGSERLTLKILGTANGLDALCEFFREPVVNPSPMSQSILTGKKRHTQTEKRFFLCIMVYSFLFAFSAIEFLTRLLNCQWCPELMTICIEEGFWNWGTFCLFDWKCSVNSHAHLHHTTSFIQRVE